MCPRTTIQQIERGVPTSIVFTAVVPADLPLGGALIPLSYVKIANVGILNSTPYSLLAGLSYQCNPTNCQFVQNSIGCVVITGSTTVPVGFYPLEVKAVVYSSVPLAPPLNISFPSASIDTGCYMLQVIEPIGINENTSSYVSCKPNPVSDKATLGFNHYANGTGHLNIINVNGQVVSKSDFTYHPGSNDVAIETSELSNGIYYYSVICGDVTFVNKLVINK
jgi:hypothetical protein